jgi:hypothetical protein
MQKQRQGEKMRCVHTLLKSRSKLLRGWEETSLQLTFITIWKWDGRYGFGKWFNMKVG